MGFMTELTVTVETLNVESVHLLTDWETHRKSASKPPPYKQHPPRAPENPLSPAFTLYNPSLFLLLVLPKWQNEGAPPPALPRTTTKLNILPPIIGPPPPRPPPSPTRPRTRRGPRYPLCITRQLSICLIRPNSATPASI